MVVYGGDEVSALVFDLGTSSLRSGYAGEDTPKSILSSAIGTIVEEGHVTSNGDDNAMAIDGEANGVHGASNGSKSGKWSKPSGTRFLYGDDGVNLWRPGMEVRYPVQEGVVHDWAAVHGLVHHSLKQLHVDPTEHPILATEPAWNPKAARESWYELAFEDLNVPAFYLANTSVLSAYAAGKGTALVLDVGASGSSAIPVYDGFILKKAAMRSQIGSDLLAETIERQWDEAKIPLRPAYLVKSKQPVETGAPARAEYRKDRLPASLVEAGGNAKTTASYHQHQSRRVVNDYIETTVQIFETKFDEHSAKGKGNNVYEFPDGYNHSFGSERFHAPEIFFDPKQYLPASLQTRRTTTNAAYAPTMEAKSLASGAGGLAQLCQDAISATDPDIRAQLYSNVVLTGAGSLLSGLADRLANELGSLAASARVRIHTPGNNLERRYATWLGGSILASLGTFHQLWISKAEWEEQGPAVIEVRNKI